MKSVIGYAYELINRGPISELCGVEYYYHRHRYSVFITHVKL